MLLDPVNAVLVDLFGFLGQHGVLQVCSVEAHGKPKNIEDGKWLMALQIHYYLNITLKNLTHSVS